MEELAIHHFNWSYTTPAEFTIRIDALRITQAANIYLTGASGCGKSTLLNLLAGVIPSGLAYERAMVFPQVAYVMHGNMLAPWLRLSQNIRLEEKLRSKHADMSVLASLLTAFGLNLAQLADLFPWQLSLGMRQRFEIAKAVAFKPNLLILDESFSGIDSRTRIDVILALGNELRRRRCSLIFTSHNVIDGLRLADYLVEVKDGLVSNLKELSSSRDDRAQLPTEALLQIKEAVALSY